MSESFVIPPVPNEYRANLPIPSTLSEEIAAATVVPPGVKDEAILSLTMSEEQMVRHVRDTMTVYPDMQTARDNAITTYNAFYGVERNEFGVEPWSASVEDLRLNPSLPLPEGLSLDCKRHWKTLIKSLPKEAILHYDGLNFVDVEFAVPGQVYGQDQTDKMRLVFDLEKSSKAHGLKQIAAMQESAETSRVTDLQSMIPQGVDVFFKSNGFVIEHLFGMVAGYSPNENKIVMGSRVFGSNFQKTLLHETTHAVSRNSGGAASGSVRELYKGFLRFTRMGGLVIPFVDMFALLRGNPWFLAGTIIFDIATYALSRGDNAFGRSYRALVASENEPIRMSVVLEKALTRYGFTYDDFYRNKPSIRNVLYERAGLYEGYEPFIWGLIDSARDMRKYSPLWRKELSEEAKQQLLVEHPEYAPYMASI